MTILNRNTLTDEERREAEAATVEEMLAKLDETEDDQNDG